MAVSGETECVVGDQLRTAGRERLVPPTQSPWFSGDVTDLPGGLLSLINTAEHAVKASACYSSGGLFSGPTGAHPAAELMPICTIAFEVQIPPFGSSEFPVTRDGSSHFSLKRKAPPSFWKCSARVDLSVKMYKVDSSIQFGSEVPAAPGNR